MARQPIKRPRLAAFDRRLLADAPAVVGVDEAGRGALAGPVVAGAVYLRREFYDTAACRKLRPLVRDSKQRNAEQRNEAFFRLLESADHGHLLFAVGSAGVEEIESLNILGATRLAMKRALDDLMKQAGLATEVWQEVDEEDLFFQETDAPPRHSRPLILVDGLPLRPFFYPHRSVVGGDGKSFAIAAASIVAKVSRDAMMVELEEEGLTGYGFARHKGYATPLHLKAMYRLGPCRHHRTVFLRNILTKRVERATFPLFEEYL